MAREYLEDFTYDAMARTSAPTQDAIRQEGGASLCNHGLTGSFGENSRPRNCEICSDASQDADGVIELVKRKIASNFDFYNQFLQLLAFPLLFPKKEKQPVVGQSSFQAFAAGPVSPEGFEFIEHIELHEMDGLVFGSQRETAKGHLFEPINLNSPTWCDRCGDFIWGVYKNCLYCKYCQITIHTDCRSEVVLDCVPANTERLTNPRLRDTRRKDRSRSRGRRLEDSGYQSLPFDHTLSHGNNHSRVDTCSQAELSVIQLERKIEEFNFNQHGLIMCMSESGLLYQGFIRVYLNLMRPINMSLSRPRSFIDVVATKDGLEQGNHDGWGKTVTEAFYLPKNTSKVIHITSDATALEVIKLLLNKFQITDNPRKFALYERNMEEGAQPTMRRLRDGEFPLAVCLSWGSRGLDMRRFVMQENDTMEIQWAAFSVPELNNFLCILDREEDEYIDQVRVKYKLLRLHIHRRLDELRPNPGQCKT